MEGPPIRPGRAAGKQTRRTGRQHACHANFDGYSICYRAASRQTTAPAIVMLRCNNRVIRWQEIPRRGLDGPKLELRRSGALGMQELLADCGVIRKLWIGEAARYRDH